MSVITSIVLENQKPYSTVYSSGDLVPYKKELDRAAKKAGVPSLSSFTHAHGEELQWAAESLGNPDTEAMDEDEREKYDDKLWKATVKTGKWYSPANGLRSVEGLLSHLAMNPSGIGDPRGPIVPALMELRKVLRKAQTAKQRFRLSIGV
jgi:hypothetical protein